MLFFGVVLLVIGLVCFFVARGQAQQLRVMSATDTYTAGMLGELHGRVTSTVGAEALCEPCEVEGVIESDAPLTGPFSGAPCVAYSKTVTREYEEDVTTTDEQGKTTRETKRGSDTQESEERRVDFWIRDASGRVLIAPDQAEIDWVETANQYENAPPGPRGGRTRTIGFRRQERALPVGTQVYVLGCAVDKQGQVAVARGPRGGQKFLISRKSERELTSSATSAARGFYYAAAGLGALGAVLTILGIVNG